MKILILWLALFDVTAAFTIDTRLSMGGYYSEPESSPDASQTHMIFGVRCIEEQLDLGDTSIVALRPADDDTTDGRFLVRYLSSKSRDLHGKTVLELGASAVSLACARLGAAEVTCCDMDETRLRILEHAHLFMNPSAPCKINTVKLEEHTQLPVTDIVVLSRGMKEASELVAQALNRKSRVIVVENEELKRLGFEFQSEDGVMMF